MNDINTVTPARSNKELAAPIPAHSPEAATARNELVKEVIGGFCEMNDQQRLTLVAPLRDKQASYQRSETEMNELLKGATPETIKKLIRFAGAMLNDDLAELKAIRAEAPEEWSANLNETITDLENGKRAMQPDLSIPTGITLEEKRRLLIEKVDTLRPVEIIAALKLIEMTGVQL